MPHAPSDIERFLKAVNHHNTDNPHVHISVRGLPSAGGPDIIVHFGGSTDFVF
jgi:hypothetical protein